MALCAIKTLFFLLCICCMGVWCNGDTEEAEGALMEKTEQIALYSAIQGFVGDWWNGSDLYPDPCGWTPIQGVSCDTYDGFWYVTSLSFGPVHDNSLVCGDNVKISPLLFELKHLKSLSFFNCFKSPREYLTTVPKENWLKLSDSLESLDFRSNPGLTGQIPSVITSLTKLQSLVLLENGLAGGLPTDIGRLTKLKRLVLSGNGFTGNIPDVGLLSELLILDLSRNSLSGSLPLTIGGCTSLLKLDLSNNFLEGKIPKEIGFLKSLTLLDLRNNRFSGGLTREIQDMSSLEELVLSNNQLGADLMSVDWKKLANLVVLDVSNMGITGKIPPSIVELRKLRFLSLSNNSLTGNLLPEMENMPCLGALYINENNITGELQFSEMFYLKMGRRFGARGNPNLCYPLGEKASIRHLPIGVDPCKHKEANLLQPNSKTLIWNKKFESNASLGLANSVSIGSVWILLVVALMTVLIYI